MLSTTPDYSSSFAASFLTTAASVLILVVGYFLRVLTLLDLDEEWPKAIGYVLIVKPFMEFSAFFINYSLIKLIQQYLEKCNFLDGSESVRLWNPYNFPTI